MPISAEQHNQRRRAAKAKQVANRVAASKSRKSSGQGTGSGSLMQTIINEKRKKQKIQIRSERNGKALLKQVDQKGMIIIRFPEDIQDERALANYRHNVKDVKAAAKQSGVRYDWHELANGNFVVAKPKRA